MMDGPAAFHGFPQMHMGPDGSYGDPASTSGGHYGGGDPAHMRKQRDLLQLQKQELEQEHRAERRRKDSKFVFRSREELEARNPSIRDGMEPDKERAWRVQYARIIQEAGINLRL